MFTASRSVILVLAFMLLDVEAALYKSVKVSKFPIKVVSSAYMIGVNFVVAEPRLFMYIKKRRGPGMDL